MCDAHPVSGTIVVVFYIFVLSYQSDKTRLIGLCYLLALPLVTQARRTILVVMPQNI